MKDSNEKASRLKSALSRLRDFRIETIGLASIGYQTGKELLQDAIETGQQQSAQPLKLSNEQLNRLVNNGLFLSTGLATKLKEESSELRQKLESRFKTEPENSSATWKVNIDTLKSSGDELIDWLSDNAKQLLDEANKEGQSLDLELRKHLKNLQTESADRYQDFLGSLGIANKKDINEINRKLILLAEALESPKSGEVVKLDRRREDRRKTQVPVKFDQRVHQRRS